MSQEPYRLCDRSGTSYARHADVNTDQMMKAFGKPNVSCADEEQGYEHEWSFEGTNGRPFAVYDRYGIYRIGAETGCPPDEVKNFYDWIQSKI